MDVGLEAPSAEGESKPEVFKLGFGAQGAAGDPKPQMFNQGFCTEEFTKERWAGSSGGSEPRDEFRGRHREDETRQLREVFGAELAGQESLFALGQLAARALLKKDLDMLERRFSTRFSTGLDDSALYQLSISFFEPCTHNKLLLCLFEGGEVFTLQVQL
jgi:hypothetical protein